ncbi:MAG: hypothetical protein LC725_10935, partial [Lentisphaerae bacterium]|nr:hypothetical protein [Lentisphaerota bacterium]
IKTVSGQSAITHDNGQNAAGNHNGARPETAAATTSAGTATGPTRTATTAPTSDDQVFNIPPRQNRKVISADRRENMHAPGNTGDCNFKNLVTPPGFNGESRQG